MFEPLTVLGLAGSELETGRVQRDHVPHGRYGPFALFATVEGAVTPLDCRKLVPYLATWARAFVAWLQPCSMHCPTLIAGEAVPR